MAGDWLKIEKDTPNKPEILKMARLLGIDRDAVFGKWVRLWAWFDSNSVDGSVDGVVDGDVDALVECDGFTSASASVGWLELDSKAEKITLPNFDIHNGQTAKNRALKTNRQRKWRNSNGSTSVDGDASTVASTREEKRRGREEKSKKEPPLSPKGKAGMTPELFVERWNSFFSDKSKIPQVRSLSKKRRKWILERLKDDSWFEAFKVAITQMPLGETNGSTWQPNFDWLIRDDNNARRLAEGEFKWRNADDPAREKRQANLRRLEAESREERLVEKKRSNADNAKATHNAINDILSPKGGSGDEEPVLSVLCGLDKTPSSANGADKPKSSS